MRGRTYLCSVLSGRVHCIKHDNNQTSTSLKVGHWGRIDRRRTTAQRRFYHGLKCSCGTHGSCRGHGCGRICLSSAKCGKSTVVCSGRGAAVNRRSGGPQSRRCRCCLCSHTDKPSQGRSCYGLSDFQGRHLCPGILRPRTNRQSPVLLGSGGRSTVPSTPLLGDRLRYGGRPVGAALYANSPPWQHVHAIRGVCGLPLIQTFRHRESPSSTIRPVNAAARSDGASRRGGACRLNTSGNTWRATGAAATTAGDI